MDSELVDIGPGPTLPVVKRRHCMTNVNATHTLMVGGYDEARMTSMFDWTTMTWSQKQNLTNPRHIHCCFTLQNTTYVIGNRLRMEKYSIAEDRWTVVANPFRRDFAQIVYYGDTVLVIGGRDPDLEVTDEIYEFDIDSETWNLRPEKLSIPKRDHLAFEVPLM